MSEPAVTNIDVPFPDAEDRHLRFSIGPSRLRIRPGEETPWAAGIYRDPTGNTPCRVDVQGGTVRISQPLSLRGVLRGVPAFDLRLGKAKPFTLTIEAGASDNSELDLGGVPITRLEIKHGAGVFSVEFSEPNPVVLDRLHLVAGAAETEVARLANANAAEIDVEGGAASFALDFGGTLQRDTRVKVNTGAASVKIRVPAVTAAAIRPQLVLGSIDAGSGFVTSDGAYLTEAARQGATPRLTIDVTVALGSLKLRTS